MPSFKFNKAYFANFSSLSFVPYEGMDRGISGPCGRCALCGSLGSHNSKIPLMKRIRVPNGKHQLTSKLNCKDCGIHAACCKIIIITVLGKQ